MVMYGRIFLDGDGIKADIKVAAKYLNFLRYIQKNKSKYPDIYDYNHT